MPKGEECQCDICKRWRGSNLPFGSLFFTNLTTEVIENLAKQNAPRGARAARRANRPPSTKKRK